MTQRPDPSTEAEHIQLLEEALAEYAASYGLTPRARALLTGSRPACLPSPVVGSLAARFLPFRSMVRAKEA